MRRHYLSRARASLTPRLTSLSDQEGPVAPRGQPVPASLPLHKRRCVKNHQSKWCDTLLRGLTGCPMRRRSGLRLRAWTQTSSDAQRNLANDGEATLIAASAESSVPPRGSFALPVFFIVG